MEAASAQSKLHQMDAIVIETPKKLHNNFLVGGHGKNKWWTENQRLRRFTKNGCL